jgi:hypothetical protein
MAFRVTRIDFDGDEEIEAVHAVTDTVTANLIRPMTEPDGFGCSPDGADGMVALRLSARAAHDILQATGTVPGNNPQYPLTTIVNNSLFGVISSLEGW